jgi:hypothetical protein
MVAKVVFSHHPISLSLQVHRTVHAILVCLDRRACRRTSMSAQPQLQKMESGKQPITTDVIAHFAMLLFLNAALDWKGPFARI